MRVCDQRAGQRREQGAVWCLGFKGCSEASIGDVLRNPREDATAEIDTAEEAEGEVTGFRPNSLEKQIEGVGTRRISLSMLEDHRARRVMPQGFRSGSR